MLSTHHDRPRNLKWYHTGAMLYGDWGTSRFYVLGLAFYYSLHASFWYVAGVCALVAAVAWAYTIICRCYPDGGGVYSSARDTSPILAIVGALLLLANYIVTAAISAYEGMHYFGLHDAWVPFAAIASILLVGAINYVGTKRAGDFAVIVAIGTLILTAVLVVFSIPHLAEGWRNIHAPKDALGTQWLNLVNVVLALSGVEAIANMTGVMVKPVDKTSKKSIWPVLIEVVVFNIILAIAMNALSARTHYVENIGATPAAQREAAHEAAVRQADKADPQWRNDPAKAAAIAAMPRMSEEEGDVKETVLRVMGRVFIGNWFAVISGVVFGLLLLSAVNTAVGGMISVQYAMSRDKELPAVLGRLNIFGVPWVALALATAVPVVILAIPAFQNVSKLADLYAIGVVGAIAINLSSCTVNTKLALRRWERGAMGLLAAVLIAIELTLAVNKPHAVVFAGIILAVGLGLRFVTKTVMPARAKLKRPPTKEELTTGRYRGQEIHVEPGGQVVVGPPVSLATFATPAEQLDMLKPKVLVATRGGQRLIEFAANYAKQLEGTLFVIYVRPLNVAFGPDRAPSFEEDAEAQKTFAAAFAAAKAKGVAMVPIYVVSHDVADAILDFAATYNVNALLMGVSRTGTVLRALRGDVLTAVADHLPQDIPLLIHA